MGFCVALIGQALGPTFESLPERTVFNVNLPAHPNSTFAWTALGRRVYEDDVHERLDPRGRPYYWIGGGSAKMGQEPGTDTEAIMRGVTSVTPLSLQRTDTQVLALCATIDLDGYRQASADSSPESEDQ